MTTNSNSNKKVYVGMSGGVDSSVTAALLVEQGYDVTGIFMKNWSGDDYGIQPDCPWEVDQADAESVCKLLGIPFKSWNFEKEYRAKVVDYFYSEYEKGRTPNPDVMCNKEVKFDVFLEKALAEGADYIATGHYAQVEAVGEGSQKVFTLLKGHDSKKDQTYFLYTLGQHELSHTLFPIGNIEKSEVRKLAKKFKLPNADKKDSQGICFIGDIDVKRLLRSKIAKKPGDIVDIDSSEVVGKHDGIMFYTIGQREGIGVSGHPEPYYVVDKDLEKNIVYVGMGDENPHLFKDEIELENLHLMSRKADFNKLECEIAVRYRQKPVKALLEKAVVGGKAVWNVKFDEKVRAIASGQSAVVYIGDECLGGGVIV